MEDFGERIAAVLADTDEGSMSVRDVKAAFKTHEAFADIADDKSWMVAAFQSMIKTDKIAELQEATGLTIEDKTVSMV